ncbi:MAG: hypothetical protein ABSH19_02220 [Opitutales bacterium]|jgi:hypothetical protein
MDSRHPFDLERELARWRQSLAAHEALTPERASELETHLRDEIAALQALGLTPRESLLVATQRLGDAPDLADQFTAADPAGVWRNRIFWIVVGVLVVLFAQPLAGFLATGIFFLCQKFGVPGLGSLVASVIPLVFVVGLLWLFIGLARGRWPRLAHGLESCCSRRERWAWPFLALAIVPALALIGIWGYMFFATHGSAHSFGPGSRYFFFIQSLYLLFPIALAVLAAAYAPRRPSSAR